MTFHGTDPAALAGCPCAACHQRRHELAVLHQLTRDLPDPNQLRLFEDAA